MSLARTRLDVPVGDLTEKQTKLEKKRKSKTKTKRLSKKIQTKDIHPLKEKLDEKLIRS